MTVLSEPVSPLDLRRASGHFATGVAVVTARHGDAQAGMTINSFSSLSLEPPLVLWSLRNNARSRAVFEAASGFAISILTVEQAFVARHFAAGGERVFDGCDIHLSRLGVPLISGALAYLECTIYRIDDGGDHRIVIGHVDDIEIREGEPLLFFNGRFAGGLTELERPGTR